MANQRKGLQRAYLVMLPCRGCSHPLRAVPKVGTRKPRLQKGAARKTAEALDRERWVARA